MYTFVRIGGKKTNVRSPQVTAGNPKLISWSACLAHIQMANSFFSLAFRLLLSADPRIILRFFCFLFFFNSGETFSVAVAHTYAWVGVTFLFSIRPTNTELDEQIRQTTSNEQQKKKIQTTKNDNLTQLNWQKAWQTSFVSTKKHTTEINSYFDSLPFRCRRRRRRRHLSASGKSKRVIV